MGNPSGIPILAASGSFRQVTIIWTSTEAKHPAQQSSENGTRVKFTFNADELKL